VPPPVIARLQPFVVGLLTYIPGVFRLITRTGGTDNPRYCYSVWLRHLVAASERQVIDAVPRSVAEVGPGDSLGTGLAALLSGVDRYTAIDAVRFSSTERNVSILNELVALFRNRAAIPDDTEFPLVSPRLTSYAFPSHLIPDEVLSTSLSEARIRAIAQALEPYSTASDAQDGPITYVAPWTRTDILPPASVDMIYSQAVLEHVDDLEPMYRAMHWWLKPSGVMSHDIDFTHHRIGPLWNSHWSYSEGAWRLIRGRRTWLLNRQPHSAHLEAIRRCGFELIADVPTRQTNGISRSELAREFKYLSDDDLATAESYILAVKREAG
jgi:hypothetical protein